MSYADNLFSAVYIVCEDDVGFYSCGLRVLTKTDLTRALI